MNQTVPPSRPTFFTLLAIALLFSLPAHRAFSDSLPFALKLNETIDTERAISAGATFESALLDGRIAWKLTDISDISGIDDIAQSRPDSWSLCAKPLSGISVRAGSIAYSGLPARANNAVFSVASPFHAPLTVDKGSLFAAGTSRKTGTVAAEIRSGIWKIAAYTALPECPDEMTWITASATIRSFSEENEIIAISAFSGTRKLPDNTDDSWTVDAPDVPGSSLFVTGGEFVFRFREMGGSATLLANAGNARSVKGMGRGEFFIDTGQLLVATGYCRSDREYRELDGSTPSVLSRFYASPQITLAQKAGSPTELRTGAILSHDVLTGEKYWFENRNRTSGGIGISLDSSKADISSRFMATSDATKDAMNATLSVKLRQLFTRPLLRSLVPSLACMMTWNRKDDKAISPESVEPRATLSCIPIDAKRMRTRVSLSYKGTVSLPDSFETSLFTLDLEQSFLGSRCSTTIGFDVSFDALELSPAGSLRITLTFR